jgi:hypothetical protein
MNKYIVKFSILFISLSSLFIKSYGQEKNYINGKITELDKCGFVINDSDEQQYLSPQYMGYSYDSLLADIELWRLSNYVKIDSIGLSVQGRPLWQLTISSNPNYVAGKRTVHVHARTHPQETEGFYVTKEMIKILLSETELAQRIRANCVFYIIPMFNPDGVVLSKPRNNANNVDLEANWNANPHQPEVAALKVRFTQLMSSLNPIEVMLNMHSSSECARYFVYHHQTGTSASYAIKEQNFINGVRNYFPGGIEPYTYFVTWTTGTPTQYPESWFWINHGENVMALTYEDMYQCSGTGSFNLTANAIIRGVMDYMGINVVPVELYSFTAVVSNSNVQLAWSTATELNNYGFEIERSTNKSDWRKIAFKEGKGTTTETQQYYYLDDISDMTTSKFYYRLKQIDFNGNSEYSAVVETEIMPLHFSLEQNYPNPFNPSTKISWQSPVSGWQTLKVYDVLGNEVTTLLNEYKETGSYEIEFDATGLTSGVYFYRLQIYPDKNGANGFVESKKMILMK